MIHIKRAKTRHAEKVATVKSWRAALKGHPAFIIGNGPSLKDISLEPLLDFFTIGINRIYRKDNFDPTILFWQDIEFWKSEKKIIPQLNAIKYARGISDPKGVGYHFQLRSGPFALPTSPHVLYGTGASGPLAFELASCMKCDPLIFLGFDCKYQDKMTNFYGVNTDHKPHTLNRGEKGLRWIKTWDDKNRHKIINCSDNDILPNKMSLEDAIGFVKETCGEDCLAKSRDFYVSLLTKKKC